MSKEVDKELLRAYAGVHSLYLANEATGIRVEELRKECISAEKELNAKVRTYVDKKIGGIFRSTLSKLQRVVPGMRDDGRAIVQVHSVFQTHVVVDVRHFAGVGQFFGFMGGPCVGFKGPDGQTGMFSTVLELHIPAKSMNHEVCAYLLADQRLREAHDEHDATWKDYQDALDRYKIRGQGRDARAAIEELSTTEEGKKTLSECGITA